MHFSIFTAVAAATFAFTLSAQASDLVDTAIAAGNLKIFVAAVKTAGFTEFLKNAGPYTVFAPSDSAFSKLPPGTWDALVRQGKVKKSTLVSRHTGQNFSIRDQTRQDQNSARRPAGRKVGQWHGYR